MHTRSRGTVSPPPVAAPVAKPKRRASTAPPPPTSILRATGNDSDALGAAPATDKEADEAAAATTPRQTKRVRFSDPGPPVSQSTGLTPSLNRTMLSTPSSRHARRSSLPLALSPSRHRSPVHVVQFPPLSASLAPRTRRQLRRSHLSETQNAHADARRELAALRAHEAAKEERINELVWELESQRQLGMAVSAAEEARVEDLSRELGALRAQMAGAEVDAAVCAFAQDEEEEWGSATEAWSPPGSAEDVRRRISFGAPVEFKSAGTQAGLEDASHAAEVHLFEQAVARLSREASAARTALERLVQELKRLGLVFGDDGDNEDEHVAAGVARVFRQARLELEYILPGETAAGFDDGRLLAVLVNHVRNLRDKLDASGAAAAAAEQREGALRGQFNKTLERVAHLESRLTVVEAQRQSQTALADELRAADDAHRALLASRQDAVDALQAQVDGHAQDAAQHAASVDKLKAALDSYRAEIASLEGLVTALDDDNAALRERLDRTTTAPPPPPPAGDAQQAQQEQREQTLEDDRRRVAELEGQVSEAQTAIFEANTRLDKEVKAHLKTRAALDELQDDIDRANGKASRSKRDSGTLCW